MCVAWIAWRDIDRVRDACNEFREHRFVWLFERWKGPVDGGTKFESYEGWRLEQSKDATILELSITESYPGAEPKLLRVHDARELLWSAASDGRIVGEAIRDRDSAVVEIPAREWRFLRATTEYRNKEVLVFDHTHDLATYKEVAFPRRAFASSLASRR